MTSTYATVRYGVGSGRDRAITRGRPGGPGNRGGRAEAKADVAAMSARAMPAGSEPAGTTAGKMPVRMGPVGTAAGAAPAGRTGRLR